MKQENLFRELSVEEQNSINGGKKYSSKQTAAVAVGTVCVAWAPVAAFIPGVGWAVAGAMALGGAGLIGKGTGAY